MPADKNKTKTNGRKKEKKWEQRGKGGASPVFKVREGRKDKAREGSMGDQDCE